MTASAHGPGTSSLALVDHLRDEHARMLSDLDRLSSSLVDAPRADFPVTRAALETWIGQVLVPHAEQEEVTYAIAAGLPTGKALLSSMEAEHRIMCEAATRFSEVWDTRSAGAWARGLYAMFNAHQRKENELLFPELLVAR